MMFKRAPYNIIYADPPWLYNDAKHSLHPGYNQMTLSDICSMPINAIADKNCALFLWAVSPMLPEALQVISAWGFEYKTVAFTWSKRTASGAPRYNLGQWTMGNTENCLLGIRGRMHDKRINKSVKQLVEAERTTHSRKPIEVRDRIVELFGDLPRIELFARDRADGWDAHGDQLEG